MSRRGVLGYQDGNTEFPERPLPRRPLPVAGVFSRPNRGDRYTARPRPRPLPILGVPNPPLPTPPPLDAKIPVAPRAPNVVVLVVVSRREGDANKLELLSDPSAKIPRMPDRRRRNNSAMSSGLDSLSLDSGIVRLQLKNK